MVRIRILRKRVHSCIVGTQCAKPLNLVNLLCCLTLLSTLAYLLKLPDDEETQTKTGHDPFSILSPQVSSKHREKSADIYGVTAEHFIYGGDELLMATVDIINSLYRVGELTDCLKVGVLTSIFKKKGSATEAKNYRGVTIRPTITKILETVLREVIRPTVEEVQSGLQRGFTQNASPMNCSLLLEEIVRESKDQKKPLYMAFLDVKAAVVILVKTLVITRCC